MECTIKALNVGCGDAIVIRYYGNDEKYHNIIIDGGYMKKYEDTLQPEIEAIRNRKDECIDLWCITHVDLDHLGGVIKFIRDKKFTDEERDELVKEYWFNYSLEVIVEIPSDSSETGVNHGQELRDYLKGRKKLKDENVVSCEVYDIYGATFQLLSPNEKNLNKLIKEWEGKERAKIKKNTETEPIKDDYKESWSDLLQKPFKENNATPNKSSISFIFLYLELKVLFLADSVPSTIISSLSQLGYNESTPLKVDYVKLSHHGSKENTNKDLLKVIDCSDFIICGNGTGKKNRLPYKETLVKVLDEKPNANFLFSCDNSEENKILQTIFTEKEKKLKKINDFYYAPLGETMELEHKFDNSIHELGDANKNEDNQPNDLMESSQDDGSSSQVILIQEEENIPDNNSNQVSTNNSLTSENNSTECPPQKSSSGCFSTIVLLVLLFALGMEVFVM